MLFQIKPFASGVRAGGTEKGPAKQPVATLPANQANGSDGADLWLRFKIYGLFSKNDTTRQKMGNAPPNAAHRVTHTGVGKINKQVFFRCGFVHPLVPTWTFVNLPAWKPRSDQGGEVIRNISCWINFGSEIRTTTTNLAVLSGQEQIFHVPIVVELVVVGENLIYQTDVTRSVEL